MLIDTDCFPHIADCYVILYLQHKLRIRWKTFFSEYFTLCNGVKQGEVHIITPVFPVYEVHV